MNRSQLESGVVPFVVLKPYASERCGLSVFSIRNKMFEPDRSNITSLAAFLNDFVIGTETGTDSVDTKFDAAYAPSRTSITSLRKAQIRAALHGCNIIGGIFLSWLACFGYKIALEGARAVVWSDDTEFLRVVYPVFEEYFNTPEAVDSKQVEYLQGVQKNNTGIYRIYQVTNPDKQIGTTLRKIAYLKRVFRYAVKTHLPFKTGTVRDNLVHSPETISELVVHGTLFAQRLVNYE